MGYLEFSQIWSRPNWMPLGPLEGEIPPPPEMASGKIVHLSNTKTKTLMGVFPSRPRDWINVTISYNGITKRRKTTTAIKRFGVDTWYVSLLQPKVAHYCDPGECPGVPSCHVPVTPHWTAGVPTGSGARDTRD